MALTWGTSYYFAQELIFLLAKPFLNLRSLPMESYFLCTQLTEAFSTYLTTATITASYFALPGITYQIWAFLIPSAYKEQRKKYKRVLILSAASFLLFILLTHARILPHLWQFLYHMGTTSQKALSIKLEPKIYDHIRLTLRITFITAISSQLPLIVIGLLERRLLSVESFTNNRRLLILFSLLTAALSTPPDISCQILATLLIFAIIEGSLFLALIGQVREEVR
uniref:MttB n=1 Tax=Codonopsis lanceolata TaxID=103999 RepID=A0A2U8XH15_9ASTR|nr:MttB [Codonopsis lanceolata]AWN57628.1 MttB [Codonopsis lanceolata]